MLLMLFLHQEDGLFTYFAEPWITERDRRFAVDREVVFKESQLYQSLKPMKPVVYGESDTVVQLFDYV